MFKVHYPEAAYTVVTAGTPAANLTGNRPVIIGRSVWYGQDVMLYERVSDGRIFAEVPAGMPQSAVAEFVGRHLGGAA